ncbi:hypothetical protein AXK56_18215 [Tsukamurella pulmonis]|nr:hypothetical protein AXK56_18215 [Tsukamurella pulmonis]
MLWAVCSAIVAALVYWTARKARNAGNEILAVALVGLGACAVTPLAWSHHWVWFVPVIVVLFCRSLSASGEDRRRWGTATVAVFVAASMWLTILIYEIVKAIGQEYAIGYVPAMDAAVAQIPSWARVLTCGAPVVVLVVVCALLAVPGRSIPPDTAPDQPAAGSASRLRAT